MTMIEDASTVSDAGAHVDPVAAVLCHSLSGSDASSLVDAVRSLAQADVRDGTDDELLEAAVAIEQAGSLLDLTRAHLLAEIDARNVTDVRCGMRTASWLSRQSGAARGPIASKLRVGRKLRSHFDEVDTAVADGTLSFDHAKALVDTANPRTTDILAAAQAQIIALAKGATFDQWRNDVAALGELADEDGASPDPYENLSLKMPITMDRTVHLDGTLDAASGAVFRQAINTKADELFRRFTRDNERTDDLAIPSRATLRALALMELLHIAAGSEPGSGSAPRAEITLVAHNHEVCDADGVPLPQAATDVWGCDPEIWGVVVDHMGIPVDVGHTKRLATIAQRHAIAIRDGGCTFPGCDAPIAWCDHHHVLDWHFGGPTDQDNLVALCRHHHGVTHRTGWSMHIDDRQVPIWTTPTGDTLIGQRHHRQQTPGDDLPPGNRSTPKVPPPRRTAEHSSSREREAALRAARARLRARILARC